MEFKIAINRSFEGKPQQPIPDNFWKDYNGRFENETMPIDSIAADLAAGHGITTQHRQYRKAANFICGQHIGLDFDTEDDNSRIDTLLQDAFIWRYASILQSTWSHTEEKPRSRVIFFLDQAIYDPAQYTELAAALLWAYGQADQVCKDPARLFFGGRGQPVIIDNVLPLETAVSLLIEPFRQWQADNQATRAATAQNRRVLAAGDVSAAILQNHSDKLLYHVRTAKDGEKHAVLRDIARTFGGYVATQYYTYQEAEAWLQSAIRSNPGQVKSLHAADKTISQGLDYGMMQPLDFTQTAVEPVIQEHVLTVNRSWREAYQAAI